MRKVLAVAWFVWLNSVVAVSARNLDSTNALQQKLWAYLGQHPFTNLFVHTDKNIYSPNERIWLKAYVLAGPIIDNKVLYVRLLDANRKPVLAAEYPMYDVRAHGDLLLPDTLKEGNYFLYAYADRMINFSPADVFMQPISIHKNRKRWRATAYIRDTAKLRRGEVVEIVVRLKQDNDLVKGIKGHYELLNGSDVVKQGGLKTNLVGESFISFTYPAISNDRTLTARIFFEDEQDYEEVLLHLGHEGNTVSASVSPEGGHAVEGVLNTMAVTVQDVNKNGVSGALVTVKTGSRVMATATTGEMGNGTISFRPQAAAVYTLDIQWNGKTQSLPFPVIIEKQGYTLKAGSMNGKQQLSIYNRNEPEQVTLVARSFEEVAWCKKLIVPVNSEATIEIPADSFPKEIIAFQLLDTAGHAMAERLWMNGKSEVCGVEITCDKEQYGTRKKVTLTVKARDQDGQPIKINGSLSVSEIHTADTTTLPDIRNYYYFRNTGISPSVWGGRKYSTEEINAVLIAKNWDGYEWNPIYQCQPQEGIRVIKNTDGVYGRIVPVNKKKKIDLTELTILSKDGIQLVSLDENGFFDIPAAGLISARNNRKHLMLGSSFYEKYTIDIRHYDQDFDKRVMAYDPLYPAPVFSTLSAYRMQELERLTDAHQLQNVVVRRTVDIPWRNEEFKSTTCNDWVCMYNILNCPNHAFGTLPVSGEIYTYHGKKVVYRSCGNTEDRAVIPLKMVYTPNVFPVTDFEKDSSNEEEVRSTLYWEPNISTGADGIARLSFFTNDIKSVFKIRLQGVTVHGIRPLSATQTFIVK